MSEVVIQAASWLDSRGYGNDRLGFREWPSELQGSVRSGNAEEAHWSALFQSDPGRFGRMDPMSRLGLMAAELLDAGIADLPEDFRHEVGVCVESMAGSLSTDLKFLQTPRASLFSYTLPSTVIGEICIRYRIRGPVLCFVKGGEDGPALAEAIRLINDGEAQACICLSCDALEADAIAKLSELSPWKSPQWEASALLLGKREGTPRERPLTDSSVRGNSARLCAVKG
jgi:3-oxoacyl-(acyl-carrier-protein) synthase